MPLPQPAPVTEPSAPSRRDRIANALTSHRVIVGTVLLLLVFGGRPLRNAFGYPGWGVLAGLTIVGAVAALLVLRPRFTLLNVPTGLVAFLGLLTISMAWSAYPSASIVGIIATWGTTLAAALLVSMLSWAEMLRAFAHTLRILLVGSLLFELVVAVFIRHPVLPLWMERPDGDVALLLYWSRASLFTGERIQGLFGNATALGFVAVLAVLVFAVQLVDKRVSRAGGIGWLAFAFVMLALAASATVVVILVACAVVTGVVLLLRRMRRRRGLATIGVIAGFGLAVAAAVALREPLLALLGRRSDLTGRTDIWASVGEFAAQRPAFGHGWTSFWMPWATYLEDLVEVHGVRQYEAHGAWMDLFLQLGVVGIVVFAILILGTLARAWTAALDQPLRTAFGGTRPYDALGMLPLLILVALLVQSIAESHMLYENGWFLLCVLVLGLKRRTPGDERILPLQPAAARPVPWS
ncbi:O-antigen ligase family protein [Arenivirga flava]|uniref:O-antigen ligase-related domain-containing protein n=1 Tax=Arenivirga flava TaxID=1930060 RepID=A0AA37UF53_9MICO|nr:O-antigen ligase family protein [Arenivirga flava]GMA27998.1 hypothetical protein GCM10025874_12510 [Arenivirga flava]